MTERTMSQSVLKLARKLMATNTILEKKKKQISGKSINTHLSRMTGSRNTVHIPLLQKIG